MLSAQLESAARAIEGQEDAEFGERKPAFGLGTLRARMQELTGALGAVAASSASLVDRLHARDRSRLIVRQRQVIIALRIIIMISSSQR